MTTEELTPKYLNCTIYCYEYDTDVWKYRITKFEDYL